MTDNVGRGRTLSDERRDEHALTSLEVAKRFEQSGIPRSQRSIERYCRDGKLDCFLDPDEDRYYATPASVETLIAQMKEIQARHESTGSPPADPRAAPGTTDAPPLSRGENDPSAVAEMETLKRENMDLKITNRAKDYFIEKLEADRRRLADDFKNMALEYGAANRRIGELEATLRLAAPQPEPMSPTPDFHAPEE